GPAATHRHLKSGELAMSRTSFFRRLFGSARPASKPVRRARLAVEALEDRAVPAVFTVNTVTDAGPFLTGEGAAASGDLRYCIAQADNAPGADTIEFALPADSVIRLSQTLRLITGPDGLSIRGETAVILTISGDANDSGVNDAGDVRVFFVMNGAVLRINNLTIAGGRAQGGASGGGFFGGGGGGGGAG